MHPFSLILLARILAGFLSRVALGGFYGAARIFHLPDHTQEKEATGETSMFTPIQVDGLSSWCTERPGRSARNAFSLCEQRGFLPQPRMFEPSVSPLSSSAITLYTAPALTKKKALSTQKSELAPIPTVRLHIL